MKTKTLLTLLGVAALLVGWGMTWANQNARIVANSASITALSGQVVNVSSQATEADKAIVRIDTKVEFILKGIEEIKSEIKSRKRL